jgi:hypothetical protein
MLLDAPAFELSLTPEIALSIIQKGIASKGWKNYEVASIKLVYTPFYVFSFDIASEQGQAPSGKAALNAYTGELNDFVPVLLDKPLKRSNSTPEKTEAEVEQTTISLSEVKDVACVKVAGFAGVAKEKVAISAVSKYYVPFYRVWVNVAGDTFKIDVDASLGAPVGLDDIPRKEKGWEEATQETIEKMKTPGGWVELGSKTVSEAGKAVGGGLFSGKNIQGIIVLVVVALFAYVLLFKGGIPGFGGTASFACAPDPSNVAPPSLFKPPSLVPDEVGNGVSSVKGYCNFTNPSSQDEFVCVKIELKADGKPTNAYTILNKRVGAGQNAPRVEPFELNWTSDKVQGNYFELVFSKC